MRCPHGRNVAVRKYFGICVYAHDDNTGCDLLNRLDARCDEIAVAYMRRAMRESLTSDHVLRFAHASYKVSPGIRFAYLEHLSRRSLREFVEGFQPVRLVMAGDDEAATSGLYLMELYFAFTGILSRINQVNEVLTTTPIYRLLGKMGVTRVLAQENETTRTYARLLDSAHACFKNVLRVPPG